MSEWKISTPIDTFEKPETGSVVDIVSTIHMADPGYFRCLGEYVISRQDEGFKVFYEGISSGDEQDADLSFVDRLKVCLLEVEASTIIDVCSTIQSSIGYVDQSEVELFRADGSFNNDVTYTELAKATSLFSQISHVYGMRKDLRKVQRAKRVKNPERFEEYVFDELKKSYEKVVTGDQDHKKHARAELDMRSEVALRGVDEALGLDPGVEIVMIWGLGHLAGLGSGLESRGYSHVSRQEVDAIECRPAMLRQQKEEQEESLRRAKIRARQDLVEKVIGAVDQISVFTPQNQKH